MSSNKNDSAFPTTPGDIRGLTKREYIAIQIAAGYAANPEVFNGTLLENWVPQRAVIMADELIKALNKAE